MKGNDLMKAMNGIDEKYLTESENVGSNNQKNTKRAFRIAISVAAAAALAIPIGAYAINTFIHRENVEKYVSNAELIEQQSPEAVKNIVTENDDYRITVDSVLSDGNIVMMVLTHEPKTDKGLQIKEHVGGCPGVCITYADGSAGPFEQAGVAGEIPMTCTLGGYAVTDETDSVRYEKTVSLFSCKDIDLSKDVKIELFADERGRAGALRYFNNRNDPDSNGLVNELDGLEFTTSFASNVESVQLHSADGKTVSMSSFNVYSDDPSVVYVPVDDSTDDVSNQFALITNDGDRKILESSGMHSREDCGFIIYGEFIDVEAYKGVEINGVEYLK